MNKYLRPGKYLAFLEKKLFGWQRIYSQCGEDLILETLIGKDRGFYVDVGANDPRHFSNTYFFYKKGWQGINIEPNAAKLKTFAWLRRRDKNLNYGVGQTDGELDFYSFREDTLSTFSAEVADDYQKMGHELLEVKKVPVRPLASILADNLPAGQLIDFMTIDTEGYDIEVLKSNDWQKYRPAYVLLESLEYKNDGTGKKLNGPLDSYMESVGYLKVADTHMNSIYKNNL
jgi:FkbM family methyltransferase